MAEHFAFKSYSWSLGTTSFRMKDFHRQVEKQLILLHDFWEQSVDQLWGRNTVTQVAYYDFIYEQDFVTGQIQDDNEKKAKTARQKTSGLVDIGLVDENRHLTAVGERLYNLAIDNDFICDNEFQIPKDSYLYLNQVLKTTNYINQQYIRPYIVMGYVLSCCDYYLTDEEFTYLLPLCIDETTTNIIIEQILQLRNGLTNIDEIIENTVLCRENYALALDYFLQSDKTVDDIMIIGMNRDGIRHDRIYADLFFFLKELYLEGDSSNFHSLTMTINLLKGKAKSFWKKLLFGNKRFIRGEEDLVPNVFSTINNENDFYVEFFKHLHIYKVKANLADYKDLNRRYLSITDSVIFEDSKVRFTPLFEYFFKSCGERAYDGAYENTNLLFEVTTLEDINDCLVFNNNEILNIFNQENHTAYTNIDNVYDHIESDRLNRFRRLIDSRFSNNVVLDLLRDFESRRNDDRIVQVVGREADVPTAFEYIIAIAWYRLSGYVGNVLEYMNLHINADLLPVTHAAGGKSDIVYKYPETNSYPSHTLLIECTLMESTTQRRNEMEPVTRHLINYMIDEDPNTYCAFVSNNMHASIVSDFCMRKSFPSYRNDTEHVDSMKLIPLETHELRKIIEKGLNYSQIYAIFEEAYNADTFIAPPQWYYDYVVEKIRQA